MHTFMLFLDFSGSVWMTNNGYVPPLKKYRSAELMREMKASRYLMSDSCSAADQIYSHSKDGWNNRKHKDCYEFPRCILLTITIPCRLYCSLPRCITFE